MLDFRLTQVYKELKTPSPCILFEIKMSRFSDLSPQAMERKMKQAKMHLDPQRGQHASLSPKSTRP